MILYLVQYDLIVLSNNILIEHTLVAMFVTSTLLTATFVSVLFCQCSVLSVEYCSGYNS